MRRSSSALDAPALHALPEALAVEALHHDRGRAVVGLDHVVDAHDVGVAHRRRGPRLAQRPPPRP
jgi:hypothetical protein